eukprot:scaffold4577_cov135-Isochrysis_galbana.AAC.7
MTELKAFPGRVTEAPRAILSRASWAAEARAALRPGALVTRSLLRGQRARYVRGGQFFRVEHSRHCGAGQLKLAGRRSRDTAAAGPSAGGWGTRPWVGPRRPPPAPHPPTLLPDKRRSAATLWRAAHARRRASRGATHRLPAAPPFPPRPLVVCRREDVLRCSSCSSREVPQLWSAAEETALARRGDAVWPASSSLSPRSFRATSRLSEGVEERARLCCDGHRRLLSYAARDRHADWRTGQRPCPPMSAPCCTCRDTEAAPAHAAARPAAPFAYDMDRCLHAIEQAPTAVRACFRMCQMGCGACLGGRRSFGVSPRRCRGWVGVSSFCVLSFSWLCRLHDYEGTCHIVANGTTVGQPAAPLATSHGYIPVCRGDGRRCSDGAVRLQLPLLAGD